MNIRQEITGDRLIEFNKFKGEYETETKLSERYGLRIPQLYEFFQKSGKLFSDGTLKERLFKSKDIFPFGPVVAANGTLYYKSNWWDRAFTGEDNAPILKEILKTDKSLQQCLGVNTAKGSEPPKMLAVKDHWLHSYISKLVVVKKGELYSKKTGRHISNPSGMAVINKNEYNIKALIRAMVNKTDYNNTNRIPTLNGVVIEGYSNVIDNQVEALNNNVQKKCTEISDSVRNIPLANYACYVTLGITKEGSRIVQHNMKNATDRIALLSLMPNI